MQGYEAMMDDEMIMNSEVKWLFTQVHEMVYYTGYT